jgi:hypothetical protein
MTLNTLCTWPHPREGEEHACTWPKLKQCIATFFNNRYFCFQHLHIHVLPRRPNDFPENDMIYNHLEKHYETPAVDSCSSDVVQEVEVLRTYLSTS